MKDILRVALAVPALKLADVGQNQTELLRAMESARAQGACVLLTPELSLTGVSCGDLFLSDILRERVCDALALLAGAIPSGLLAVVGAPLLVAGQLYDCAVVLGEGRILGAVPKQFLTPAERRVFASGADLVPTLASVGCFTFPVGADLLFRAADGTVVGLEIGADLMSAIPPSSLSAASGAEVILNPGAALALVEGRSAYKKAVLERSARSVCAYLYAGAGMQESTADGVYSGQLLAALNGSLQLENSETVGGECFLCADLDLGCVRYDRLHDPIFAQAVSRYAEERECISFSAPLCESDGSLLKLNRLPFIPESRAKREERCAEIFEIQASALARRLSVVGGKAVIGISGGLDSTLAVLVATRAMKKLGLPASNITAITMPCFGTSDDTLSNALELMETLGVSMRTVVIKDAVLQHFADIGHDPKDFSVTYENAQARERTQVLMDVANQVGGIVIGTGDLSEMALGWCTYNGDHMSMYGVNCDVPKTLVRWVIETLCEQEEFAASREVLKRILDTPISPELLPPDAVGKIAQKTEDIVGPYALHDFFLYYAVRYQYRPAKIYALACMAFEGLFEPDVVKRWLLVFWRRFFTQQFKRNCVPDGVKVGSIALSPRTDWQMPSDAGAGEWLREIEEL